MINKRRVIMEVNLMKRALGRRSKGINHLKIDKIRI